MDKGYVIWNWDYGYYTGNILYGEGIYYISGTPYKEDKDVKVYTSEKRAINAAENLKKRCSYFDDYRIETK